MTSAFLLAAIALGASVVAMGFTVPRLAYLDLKGALMCLGAGLVGAGVSLDALHIALINLAWIAPASVGWGLAVISFQMYGDRNKI